MTSQALVMRSGSALVMLLASEALLRYARSRALDPLRVQRLAWGAWWITRPLLTLVVFLILGVPLQSDVVQHYVPQAQAALAGELVYRDFPSSYGPLFPYLAAGVITLGTSPLALVAAAIAFEAVAMRLWLDAQRSAGLEGRAQADGLLAYVCTPFVIWDVALEGHNTAWISAGLALCVWLGTAGRSLAAGLALALTAAAVKVLALVAAPALLLSTPRPLRFGLGLGLGLLLLHAPLTRLGADPTQPLVMQAASWTSGNLLFVLAAAFPELLAESRALLRVMLAQLVVLGVALDALGRAGRARTELPAIEAALCLACFFLLFISAKAYAHYAVIAWLPACFLLARGGLRARRRVLLYALGLLITIEPALWFHALDQRTLDEALHGAFSSWVLAAFFAVELALLAAYAGLLRAAWLGLVPSKTP